MEALLVANGVVVPGGAATGRSSASGGGDGGGGGGGGGRARARTGMAADAPLGDPVAIGPRPSSSIAATNARQRQNRPSNLF